MSLSLFIVHVNYCCCHCQTIGSLFSPSDAVKPHQRKHMSLRHRLMEARLTNHGAPPDAFRSESTDNTSVGTMSPPLRPQPDLQTRGGCRRLGSRHLQVFLMSMGFAITYVHRVNMSVVLVAIVNSTQEEKERRTSRTNLTCEFGPAIFNASDIVPAANGDLHSFAWSKFYQGLLLSSYFWAYALPLLPAASLLKRFSSKHMFGVGFGAPALIAMMIPAAARWHIYALMAVRALQGFFESLVVPSSGTLLARWVPKSERTILFNLCMLGGLVGTIIGTGASGCLATSRLGWPSVFYIEAAVSLLWVVPWGIFGCDSPAVCCLTSHAEWAHILGREPTEEELMARKMKKIPKDEEIPSAPWLSMLRDPPVLVFILCQGTRDWLFNVNLACLPQFASDVLRLDADNIGLITAMLFFVNLILPVIISTVSDLLIHYRKIPRGVLRKLFTGIALYGTFVSLFLVSRVGCNFAAILGLLILNNIVISFSSGGFLPNPVDLSDVFSGAIFSSANMLSTVACILSPIVADLLTPQGTLKEWGKVFDIGGFLALSSCTFYILLSASDIRPWSIQATREYLEEESDEEESSPLILNNSETEEVPNYGAVVEVDFHRPC